MLRAASVQVNPLQQLAMLVSPPLMTLIVALATRVHRVIGTLGEAVLALAVVCDDGAVDSAGTVVSIPDTTHSGTRL